MLLNLVEADKGLHGEMMVSVVSLAILCQFLCIISVSSLPMSRKGITMRRTFVSVCGVRWDNR